MSAALRAPKAKASSLTINDATSSSVAVPSADQWDSLLLVCMTADCRYRFGDENDDAVQTDIWLKAGVERVVAVEGEYLHAIVESGGGNDHELEYCPVSTRRV